MSEADGNAGTAAAAVGPGRRPRVAIVLGSGGIKCASAIGLWRVLEREGIPVDLAVGCSGGSMYAAGMALGVAAAEAQRLTYQMWEGSLGRVDYRSVLRGLLPKWFGVSGRLGLLNDRLVRDHLASIFGDATFGDTRIPLHVAATDLHSGERVEISSGRIRDAVRASIAIPVLLRPWPHEGRLLIDGGASDPLPVSIAIREGADIILAMGFESALRENVGSLIALAAQSSSIAINHLLRSTYAFYSAAHHAEIVPMMPAFDRPIRVTDAHLLPLIIEKGEEAAEAELPYLRRLLSPATQLDVH